MLTKREIQTLKVQAAMVAGLFGVCIAGAVFMLVRPDLVERRVAKLQIKPQPVSQKTVQESEQIAKGSVDPNRLRAQSEQDKRALLTYWVDRADAPENVPALLASVDPVAFLGESERLLVCGTPVQRERALRFLELAGREESVPILRKYAAWAQRRNELERVQQTQRVIDRLITARNVLTPNEEPQ